MAKYRPRVPILAITPHPEEVTRLKLRWGVTGLLIDSPESISALFETGVELARRQGLARAGVEDIATVEGISRQLAKQVYEAFHGND